MAGLRGDVRWPETRSCSQRVWRAKLPGALTLTLHAASEWCASARALESVLADIALGGFIVATMLFLEDHYLPIIRRAAGTPRPM